MECWTPCPLTRFTFRFFETFLDITFSSSDLVTPVWWRWRDWDQRQGVADRDYVGMWVIFKQSWMFWYIRVNFRKIIKLTNSFVKQYLFARITYFCLSFKLILTKKHQTFNYFFIIIQNKGNCLPKNTRKSSWHPLKARPGWFYIHT